MSEAETEDDFLGGKITLLQPKKGYRAGVDPVFLAAATPAKSGQSVLELGCGAGAASLCLHARVPNLSFTGVEVQGYYAELARRNAARNGAHMEIYEADLRELPLSLRNQQFDHVIANPPYYERDKSTASEDAGRDIALGGDTPLSVWIDVAAKRLKPKGYFTLIQKADRLGDVLAALQGKLGSIRVKPLAPRVGRNAELVLVQARKGGRGAFVLEAPVILHQGDRHMVDGESYVDEILTVLRNGASLPWGR